MGFAGEYPSPPPSKLFLRNSFVGRNLEKMNIREFTDDQNMNNTRNIELWKDVVIASIESKIIEMEENIFYFF